MGTLLESLQTAIFGMAVVFSVLVGLIILIKLLNMALTGSKRKVSEPVAESVFAASAPSAPAALAATAGYAPDNLKLIDVDERTAAIIMAIVCDEIGVPANELYFKSIRLLGNQVPAQNKGV